MSLSREVGLSPGDIVLEWDPALPPPKAQFLAHVYCGQTAVWIKMPLGTELDLSSGHIVLDRDPSPTRKRGTAAPFFGPCLLWPRSLISAAAELLYEVVNYNYNYN